MSDNGAFGRRMPPSCGGDWESRERGKVCTLGELKEVEGAEPVEYTDTGYVSKLELEHWRL